MSIFGARGIRKCFSQMFSQLIFRVFVVQLAAMATVSLGQCRFPASSTNRLLTYRFESEPSPTAAVLHIVLEFQGNAQGVEQLDLPSHWDPLAFSAHNYF